MKDISIVIPAYNASETIKACIDSVVKNVKDANLSYEIIVVDDGSKDNTLELLQKMAKKNKNIIPVTHKNAGPSAARNNGMKRASGKYIALNDSDDIWFEGKLKQQFDYLEQNPDVALVCSNYGKLNITDTFEITYKQEMFHNYFSPQTSVFRREVIQDFIFNEKMKYSEDMRFFLDVMSKYKCVFHSVLSTKNYFDKATFGSSGLSSHLWEMEKGELSNIKYVFKKGKIGFLLFIAASIYSFIKFLRRCLISAIRK